MTMLSGPSAAPAAGGPPRQLVVLLHGVGADGADLITLSQAMAQALPHARFVAPHISVVIQGVGKRDHRSLRFGQRVFLFRHQSRKRHRVRQCHIRNQRGFAARATDRR